MRLGTGASKRTLGESVQQQYDTAAIVVERLILNRSCEKGCRVVDFIGFGISDKVAVVFTGIITMQHSPTSSIFMMTTAHRRQDDDRPNDING